MMLRSTASPESMARLDQVPTRPPDARPLPEPPLAMTPGVSRYQRHTANLKERTYPETLDLTDEHATVDLTDVKDDD